MNDRNKIEKEDFMYVDQHWIICHLSECAVLYSIFPFAINLLAGIVQKITARSILWNSHYPALNGKIPNHDRF